MRTILILIFLFLFFITALPFLLIAYLIGLFSKKLQFRYTFIFGKFWSRTLLLLGGTRTKVLGLENIPNEAVLFVGNHRSWFDIPILYSYLPKTAGFVSKEEVKKVPFLNWWMSSIGCIFLNRTDVRKAMQTILEGIDLLKKGHSLVIFPEGTRSKTEGMLPFKQGSLKLAEKAIVPIIPFSIKGSDNILEKHGKRVTSTDVILTFGKPIHLQDLSVENKKASAQYVQNIVQFLYESEA